MAFGKETIGTAFVRILADGSQLPKSIKKDTEKAVVAAEVGGEDVGEAFEKARAKEAKKHNKFLANLQKELDKAQGIFAARGDTIGNDFQKRIADHVTDMLSGGQFDKGAREIGERVGRNMAQGLVENKGLNKDFVGSILEAVDQIQKEEVAVKKFGKRVGRSFREANTEADKFIAKMRNVNDAIARGAGKGSRNDFLNLIGSMAGVFASLSIPLAKGTIGIGKMVGKVPIVKKFGKGVQDAFLNGAGAVGEFAGKINAQIGEMGKFGQVVSGAFSKIGSSVGTGLLSAGAALPSITAIVVALAAAMPLIATFVSAVSGILAGSVAILGSLSFAVVGALAPLLPLILPITAAVAGLGLAFIGMSDDVKKSVGKTLKPLKKDFQDLGAATREGLFGKNNKNIRDIATQLHPAIQNLKPLFRGVGGAMAQVGINFAKAVNSPGFKAFTKAIQGFITRSIPQLGNIIKNSLGGLGGVFQAAIPFAERFLGWLEKITKRFSDFANSKEGQTKIRDFFERGVESALKVWDLIKQVGKAIGILLNAGKSTGDSLLGSLADNVEKFVKFLEDNPNALTDWFKNGKDTFEQIGKIVKQLGDLADVLDSAEFRDTAQTAFTAIRVVLVALKAVVQALLTPFTMTVKSIKLFIEIIKNIPGWAKKAWAGLKQLWSFLKDKFQAAWDKVKEKISGFGETLKALPGKVINGIKNGFQNAMNWITGTFLPFIGSIPGRILTFLGQLAGTIFTLLFQGFQAAINWITNTFLPFVQSIPGKVIAFFQAAPGFIKDFFVNAYNALVAWINGTFLPWVKSLPGKVRAAFTGGVTWIKDFFVKAYNNVKSWITGTFIPWVKAIPGRVKSGFTGSVTFIKDFFVKAWAAVKNWWTNTAWPWVKGLPGEIVGAFEDIAGGLAGGIEKALKSAVNAVFRGMNKFIRGFNSKTPPGVPDLPLFPMLARGGIVDGARVLVAGEAGPEAIVPLNRSLAQVDPAVRALSAFAQGKTFTGTTNNTGKVVNVGGLTVVSPSADPKAVAAETVNKLVGASYI